MVNTDQASLPRRTMGGVRVSCGCGQDTGRRGGGARMMAGWPTAKVLYRAVAACMVVERPAPPTRRTSSGPRSPLAAGERRTTIPVASSCHGGSRAASVADTAATHDDSQPTAAGSRGVARGDPASSAQLPSMGGDMADRSRRTPEKAVAERPKGSKLLESAPAEPSAAGRQDRLRRLAGKRPARPRSAGKTRKERRDA